jgi:hypothetical protein
MPPVRRWLDDIHHHIILAERFADGMDYDALRDDLRTTPSSRNWRCWGDP